MLASEIIRRKRDGDVLGADAMRHFAAGLADGSWSDAQVGAMAMAIVLRGLDDDETVALTLAMRDSGAVLDWSGAGFDGPVLDKHSTGGVGDKVSLLLAPIVAACGGVVPMVSGRGLGHTGGTLDKLEALRGYSVAPDAAVLRTVLQQTGCAIVGASARIAPADRRLYAVRDVTATVESLPLITASILSKKLAAGLQGLVLDVKVGNGAFLQAPHQARALAASLLRVAARAGLPAAALLTDMNQVLGTTAGNALEVQEAIDFLTGRAREPRLQAVTLALCGRLLQLGGLAPSAAAGADRALAALDSGAAAERFARMVYGLGGPADVLNNAALPTAPVRRPVPSPRAGVVTAVDTRALGIVVIELGGGRRREGDAVDVRVGLAGVLGVGVAVDAGTPLAWVHAADAGTAERAVVAVTAAISVADSAPMLPALLAESDPEPA